MTENILLEVKFRDERVWIDLVLVTGTVTGVDIC
jgi:hypothetical protein